jgi:hypothetical protein
MTESIVSEKRCPFCNETKPVSEFHKAKHLKDGFNNKCKVRVKAYYDANAERIRAKAREYGRDNLEAIMKRTRERKEADPDKFLAERRDWARKNRDRINKLKRDRRANPEVKEKEREYLVKWRKENSDHIRGYGSHFYHTKRKFNINHVLSRNFSNQISKALKERGGRKRGSWETILGYTTADLKSHLMRTMPDGYVWGDYLSGELHVDHIIPISAHNYESQNDIDFKRCWALSNLRLLPRLENMRKKDKLDKPFQPSLAGI